MDIRNDLIPLTAMPLPALFHDADAMNKVLAQIQREVLAETADPATEDGRTAIKALAYRVSRGKTALDDVGKPLADAARKDWDSINAIRKTAKEFLDALRDTVRKPVSDWEAAEGSRVAALEKRLSDIEDLAWDRSAGTEALGDAVATAEAIEIDNSWEEFQDDAAEKKAAWLVGLRRELEAAKEEEAKEAELETLRAEKLEREAADAERNREMAIKAREQIAAENARKQATIAAESALEREKDRAAREVQDAENRAAAATRRAADAARQERESIEAEREADEAERREREANDAHRHDRQETIFKALTRAPINLSEGDATRVVGAAAEKLIPFLRIEY